MSEPTEGFSAIGLVCTNPAVNSGFRVLLSSRDFYDAFNSTPDYLYSSILFFFVSM